MKALRSGFIILALGLLLAACASPGGNQPNSQAGARGGAGAQTGGAEQQGQGQAVPLGGQNQQQGGELSLNNPNSPLAKRNIYFDFDQSQIKPKYTDILNAHASYLVAHPKQKVRLEGNTDERGTREYNIALGDRRAQSVRRYLLFQGVLPDQITTVSYGEERPADPRHTPAAWAKNRRVHISYLQH
jgi:peptidoglycan-associated lipoprotein